MQVLTVKLGLGLFVTEVNDLRRELPKSKISDSKLILPRVGVHLYWIGNGLQMGRVVGTQTKSHT